MPPYGTIKTRRISDQVFEQLRDLIFRGQLKPGDQILPERELAKVMGVSRPTIREAIRKLVDRDLVKHRQGQGTFVCSPDAGLSTNPFKVAIDGIEATPLDLMEVRLGLECNSAMLAAARATEEDIALIEKGCAEMRAGTDEGGVPFDEDTQFHMRIAYAGKNPVQIHVAKYLQDFLRLSIKANLLRLFESPANVEAVLSQHENILEAIRQHDTLGAFHAMHRHIAFVIDFLSSPGPPLARSRSDLLSPVRSERDRGE
ncbi:MAG: FadR family transcriptional regulator [Deltaproteobacteria bacterium]|nr:FadR family transcriptional regulator [Deltaproteobacteria bacterium]